jgi:hypothetical protein
MCARKDEVGKRWLEKEIQQATLTSQQNSSE